MWWRIKSFARFLLGLYRGIDFPEWLDLVLMVILVLIIIGFSCC